LVFIDETGASTKMARRYGRCHKDQRLVAKEPWGHWQTMSFTGALRLRGLTAPMLLEGPMDGAAFRLYVSQFLVPTLHQGDIVIMDNLPSHGVTGITEAITATGARLRFLPPYSPDLNPIEQAFAKIKSALRAAAARSSHALNQSLAHILKTISPNECAAYLANAGYST
jgi:transposase